MTLWQEDPGAYFHANSSALGLLLSQLWGLLEEYSICWSCNFLNSAVKARRMLCRCLHKNELNYPFNGKSSLCLKHRSSFTDDIFSKSQKRVTDYVVPVGTLIALLQVKRFAVWADEQMIFHPGIRYKSMWTSEAGQTLVACPTQRNPLLST